MIGLEVEARLSSGSRWAGPHLHPLRPTHSRVALASPGSLGGVGEPLELLHGGVTMSGVLTHVTAGFPIKIFIDKPVF